MTIFHNHHRMWDNNNDIHSYQYSNSLITIIVLVIEVIAIVAVVIAGMSISNINKYTNTSLNNHNHLNTRNLIIVNRNHEPLE